MKPLIKKVALFCLFLTQLLPVSLYAQGEFNPNFIISDPELQDSKSWQRDDIQKFLDSKGSYLRNLATEDAGGAIKSASDIIFDASQLYQINPKFLLVTLQKEQSLVTDDSPTQKQLDWATGFGVCDSCSLDDTKVIKYKGFGKQVDNAAGIMRFYYQNQDKSYIKKKDTPIRIDSQDVTPGSWATAFLYTYTPHIHGNKNFWRIWDTWFEQLYPDGTILESASSSEVWLIQGGKKRKFKNRTALITRVDPKMAIVVPDVTLDNYQTGSEIAFPNYSILQSSSGTTYLLDYDTLRPFASDDVVRKLGYNPDEIIPVAAGDVAGYPTGATITASTTAPQGVIYQITDLGNAYFLLKDNVLKPIADSSIIETNFKVLRVEKHKRKELAGFGFDEMPVQFANGSLIQVKGASTVYVIDQGKKRRIADDETFNALGYKKSNIVSVDLVTTLNIPSGETLYVNSALLSSKNKYLGDTTSAVSDLVKAKLPAYVVAEYPSGRIIAGKDIDTPRPIASLTKLLTAYEALNQNLKLDSTTAYNVKKYNLGKPGYGIRDGQKLKNSDIVNAMLVGSVNDFAKLTAAGTGLSESEFLNKIGARISEWGADNTVISDTTGLSPDNKSTPRDILKIFTKVLSNKTINTALSLGSIKINGKTIQNTNDLLRLSTPGYTILASKTGYTDEASGVLVMLVQSKKTKKQYTIVSMGNSDAKNRFAEPNRIAEWISTADVKITTNK